MKSDIVFLYGRNALYEALVSTPDAVKKVFLDTSTQGDKTLTALLQKNNIPVSAMSQDDKHGHKDQVHQGVIARVDTGKLYQDLDRVIKKLSSQKKKTLLLLDELQDPHNVGAIIRSAVAFGVDAVLLPEHNQALVTGAVIKTSAGMVFKVPLIKIANVNQSLRTLKKAGYWIYGLAVDRQAKSLEDTLCDDNTVLIVGNEGDGIRQKTLELCDEKIFIPIDEKCESLNASVSAAVALFHIQKR